MTLHGAGEVRDRLNQALPAACRDMGRNWINGQWADASSHGFFETVDPSTGRVLHRVATADEAQVSAATLAASAAAESWWALDGQVRASVFWMIAKRIREKRQELALLDTLDAGRPIRDTTSRDVERAARIFEFFAGITDRLRGASIPVQPGFRNHTVMEPYGVVGAIIPWNYPLTNAATKIAPAMATGNAVVLKPSEETPLSALLLAEIAHEAGLPAGVLNVVNGPGKTTGEALVRDPRVNKLAFTGSTAVGRRIAAAAAKALKSVTLELGRKVALYRVRGCGYRQCGSAALFSLLSNQGQTCTAATRLLVARSVQSRMLGRMRELARDIESAIRSIRPHGRPAGLASAVRPGSGLCPHRRRSRRQQWKSSRLTGRWTIPTAIS